MSEEAKRIAAPVLDALASSGMLNSATVVLVGSSARRSMHERSDIDVLVVHDDDRRISLDRPGDIHLQQDSRSRFIKRLEDGDDYPGWALRYGIPVRDPAGWWSRQVAAELDNPHWPDWRPKADYAKKRINIAGQLLDTGDVDAASEEMMFAASHVARAVLLQHGQFPLSRMELASQLGNKAPELAALLDRLISGDMNSDGLRSGEKLLNYHISQLQGPSPTVSL